MITRVLLVVLLALVPLGAAAGDPERATFVVHCYDVGANALQGRPGVLAVERGWLGFREVDRVSYDPQLVSREQLETWLKEADTYVRTVDDPPREKHP